MYHYWFTPRFPQIAAVADKHTSASTVSSAVIVCTYQRVGTCLRYIREPHPNRRLSRNRNVPIWLAPDRAHRLKLESFAILNNPLAPFIKGDNSILFRHRVRSDDFSIRPLLWLDDHVMNASRPRVLLNANRVDKCDSVHERHILN
jgi:hypothetical protein